jgi:hypothetical protein
MKANELHVGQQVYWTDPDNDECSGYYKVHHISTDEIIIITPLDESDGNGGITEVFINELSDKNDRDIENMGWNDFIYD